MDEQIAAKMAPDGAEDKDRRAHSTSPGEDSGHKPSTLQASIAEEVMALLIPTNTA